MEKLSYPKDKIQIVLAENIHPQAVDVFHENGYTNIKTLKHALSPDELRQIASETHVLGIRSGTHLRKETFPHFTKLLTVGCFCIGTNQVDLHAAMVQGIPIFNDPHSSTRSVAEMTIGLIISLLRDLYAKSNDAHAGRWHKFTEGSHEIRGKTLGIVGYGRIGSQVSILAESLGMRVLYYDIEKKLSMGNAKSVPTLEELISHADVVTLHVPETKQTKNLIGKEQLKLFKKGGYLINTSRGNVVDIQALDEALESKKLKGAAVDVYPKEPEDSTVPFVNPLQRHPHVIMTPHIGGATVEAQESIAISVAQKVIYFLDRGSTEGSPNFPQLSLSPNEQTHRILHIHNNIPGMLSQINTKLAEKNINIIAQYLQTNAEIGYVVFDIQKAESKNLLKELQGIEGTIRARILY
jgi:D-3-phosphoglycerate dehydrogenase